MFVISGISIYNANMIRNLDTALVRVDRQSDPCSQTGGGWIAEEAFATALLCFFMFPDDPVTVLRRAVVTSGDSDSIACIAGAFAGAGSSGDDNQASRAAPGRSG